MKLEEKYSLNQGLRVKLLDSFHAVPDGYNGDQLTNIREILPFSVALDWLTINLKSKTTELNTQKNGLWDFQEEPYQTKLFTKVTKVFFDNDQFAVLTHVPPNGSVLKNDFCQLQFENHVLYWPKEKLFHTVSNLLDHLQAEFSAINRLDMAIDFPKDSKLFFDPEYLCKDLMDGRILLGGKPKHLNFYTVTEDGKAKIQGFSLGKRNQARYIRCYNKTEELIKKPKDWIKELHEQINAKEDIYRLEIQLTGRFFNMFPEFGFEAIFRHMDYLNLFQLGVKSFLDPRINEGKKRMTENRPLSLFDWHNITGFFPSFDQVDFTKRPRNIQDNQIESAKRTIKANFKEYYKDQDELTPLVACNYLINRYSLNEFFQRKFPEWLNEFDRKAKVYNSEFVHSVFSEDFKYIRESDFTKENEGKKEDPLKNIDQTEF